MNLSRQRAAVIVGALAFLIVIVVASWAGRPITVDSVLSTLIVGVSVGSIYAIAASGIVVTYTTSGIFNFAQGAIGMFMAFVYWELRVNRGIPAPIALFLTILVIAPALGALIERVLIRLIVDSSLVVQLVVTLGLMFALMGLAVTIWNPTSESRSIDFFFGSSGFGRTLQACDVFDLLLSDGADFVLIRLSGPLGDIGRPLEQDRSGRSLRDKTVRTIGVNRDDDRNDQAFLILCRCLRVE